jgi:hypothetical protein
VEEPGELQLDVGWMEQLKFVCTLKTVLGRVEANTIEKVVSCPWSNNIVGHLATLLVGVTTVRRGRIGLLTLA